LLGIGDREPDHQLLLGLGERPPRAGIRRQQRLEGADQTRPVVLIPQDLDAKPPLRRIGTPREQGKRRILPVRYRQRPCAQQTPLPAQRFCQIAPSFGAVERGQRRRRVRGA
jgi:hypothetical protein